MTKYMIGLPPGTTQTFGAVTSMPRVRGDVLRDRVAALRQPRCRTVAGPAVVERLFGRLLDVRRRREVGLPDLEVDDVAALRLERAGPGQHLEGGFGPDPGHAFGELHGCGRDTASVSKGRETVNHRVYRASAPVIDGRP